MGDFDDGYERGLWGADGIALTSDPGFEAVPSITVTSGNDVIVAWSRPTSEEAVVIMQKITPEGTLSWGDSGITYHDGSYSYAGPRVLGVEDDNFIMAFYKETGEYPYMTRHIFQPNVKPIKIAYVAITARNKAP